MMEDPALVEWARKYALGVEAEAKERFPGDASAQIRHCIQRTGNATTQYHKETGQEAPESLWLLVDLWHMQPKAVRHAPYDPATWGSRDCSGKPAATAQQAEFAEYTVRRAGPVSPERCIWDQGVTTACAKMAEDFYCREHTSTLAKNRDPGVRAAWERFQRTLASYRQLAEPPATRVVDKALDALCIDPGTVPMDSNKERAAIAAFTKTMLADSHVEP